VTPNDPALKCITQTFPDPSFSDGLLAAAPIVGRVAMALQNGGEIYGPIDGAQP